MTVPTINALPEPPVRSDAPVDFTIKADAFLGALPAFGGQANVVAMYVNGRAADAENSAASVFGIQQAVSADRVLSQQAAVSAAGSASAALAHKDAAVGAANRAEQSAASALSDADRADAAKEYVEGMVDGAAPLNSPNFTGVVKINNVPLGYAATAQTVGDGEDVMRGGAYGIGSLGALNTSSITVTGFVNPLPGSAGRYIQMVDNGYGWRLGLNASDTVSSLTFNGIQSGVHQPESTLFTTLNLLDIGPTQASARTALNIFADTSGVMTDGPGQLSNDMSSFLSSMTFDEMSSKIGGCGEIDFTTLGDNATALTPAPGKAYWLTKTGATALTTEFACSHAPGKIRTWHVIVSKGSGANNGFIPTFRVSGLTETSVRWSGGGTIKPEISGVSHVMIMFMQIDQSIRATIVDGW